MRGVREVDEEEIERGEGILERGDKEEERVM